MIHPSDLRRTLTIDTPNGPKSYADALDSWQQADFEAADKLVLRVCGQDVPGGKLRLYLERPRGHDKTGGIAATAIAALTVAERPIKIVVAAGDRDQAQLDRDAIEAFVRPCPLLAPLLDVQAYRVVNRETGSVLDVLSSDAQTSYGLTPHLIICDELTNWPLARGEALWHSLFSAAAKRANCGLIVLSNAGLGMGDSWQWNVREAARLSSDWHFSRLDGPKASWITPAMLAEQRRMLPAGVYQRLWENRWISDYSDLFIPGAIDRSLVLPGPSDAEQGFVYVGAVDLGLSRDTSSFVIIGKRGTRYKLCRVWQWRPPAGGKVLIEPIEQAIVEAHRQYRFHSVGCDPWQAAQLVERCRQQGVPISERPQTGANLVQQATMLVESLNSGALEIFDFPALTYDLRHLRCEERSFGYRLVSDRSAGGHGDNATALSICLALAKDIRANSGEPMAWGGMLGAVNGPQFAVDERGRTHQLRPSQMRGF